MRIVNLILKVMMFFLPVCLLVPNARASVNVIWDVQGLNYNWTIVSADTSRGDAFDCGNILTGKLCYVSFIYGFGPGGKRDLIISKDYVNLRGWQGMSGIIATWQRDFLPKSGTIYNLPYYQQQNPGAYFLIYVNGKNSAALLGSEKDGFINPPPPITPEPEPVSCSLDGNIDLPHGVLTADALNGNVKAMTKRVTCNRQATVKINVRASSGGDVVNLRSNGSLRSQLKVNNVNGSTGSTFVVPGTVGANVNISSTLITSGSVTPGNFSGSAVAIISIL
ncbi:MrpH family fimbial adhesin [Serratia ureilytica]|uniref:MrpH family fimbial adhesin n=1 Tax=Serratia ureilytica TaxID=300181 RepID=UPI0018E7E0E0|nr:hypothetical protein [Serratia ureilytica]MBJ2099159.1 hypothetical protein [Serratia ureilytica]